MHAAMQNRDATQSGWTTAIHPKTTATIVHTS